MKQRLTVLKKSSSILFILLITSSALNYFFQLVMGQFLDPEEFGLMNVFFSLINIINIPTGILSILASKYTAHYASLDKNEKARAFIGKLFKVSGILAIFTLAFGFISALPLNRVLKLPSSSLVAACFVIAAISYCSPVLFGALQGKKKFTSYGIVNIISSGARLIFSIFFIFLGWRIGGVLIASAFSYLCMLLAEYISLHSFLKSPYEKNAQFFNHELRQYIIGCLLVQTCSALLANGDMLLIKTFIHDSNLVGLYASGMVIGKIPLYIVSTITIVLFPLVAERVAKHQTTFYLLIKSLLLSGVISLLFSFFLLLFGKPIMQLFFNERYVRTAEYFFPICCFTFSIVLITVQMQYFLSLGRTKILSLSLLLGFFSIWILAAILHPTIDTLFFIMSITLLVVFFFNLIYAFLLDKKVSQMH